MSTEMKSENRRWTAKRKSALVLDIFKGKTTVSEASRAYDLSPSVFVKQVVRFLMQLIRHFSLTRYSPSMGLARPL